MNQVNSLGGSVPSLTSSESPESLTVTPEGYSYSFVPPLGPNYTCPICLCVLREPRQTKCGHRFCRDCICRWMSDNGNNNNNRCPVDNEGLTEADMFPDNCIKREILSCKIKCPNHEEGCQELTSIIELQTHLDVCTYALVPCPSNCPCVLPRCEVESHLANDCGNRILTCSHCFEKMTASALEMHASVCPKEIVQCSNCRTSTPRDEMDYHLRAVCKNVEVKCPFHALGCKEMIRREIEEIHLSSNIPSHLKMLSLSFNSLLGSLNSLTSSFRQIPNRNNSSHRLAWQNNAAESEDGAEFGNEGSASYQSSRFSEQFAGPGRGLGPRSVSSSGGEITRNCEFTDGVSLRTSPLYHSMPPPGTQDRSSSSGAETLVDTSTPKNIPLNGSRSITSLSGSLTNDMKPVPEVANNNSQQFRNSYQTAVDDSQIITDFSDFAQSLRDVCLFQQRMLETQQTITHNLCSKMAMLDSRIKYLENEGCAQHCCGDYFWTIPDFSSYHFKALNEETTILHSPPFYSSPWGYKLCLRVNMNGTYNQQGEHYLSLFIHFMQGDNDHLLNWPFNGQIVLSVIDQNQVCKDRRNVSETLKARPDVAAFQKPTSARNHKGFGYTDFIALNALMNGSYIKEDCLVVRAQVFPSPA